MCASKSGANTRDVTRSINLALSCSDSFDSIRFDSSTSNRKPIVTYGTQYCNLSARRPASKLFAFRRGRHKHDRERPRDRHSRSRELQAQANA